MMALKDTVWYLQYEPLFKTNRNAALSGLLQSDSEKQTCEENS